MDSSEVFEKNYRDKYLDFEIAHEFKGDKYITINKNTGEELTEDEENKYSAYIKAMYAYEIQEWNAIWDSIKKDGMSWWD